MKIKHNEAALLGLLAESPMHPYQIEKTVEFRSMRTWTDISMSTIYKTLRKLEEKGLADSSVGITGKNIAQKTYRITDAGLEALRGRFFEDLSTVEPLKWKIDVALYNLAVLGRAEALESLKSYRRALEECLEGYRRLEEYLTESGCPSFVHQVAVRPQYLYRGEIEWADRYVAELAKEEGEWTNEK